MNNEVPAFTARFDGGLANSLLSDVKILDGILARDLRKKGMGNDEIVKYMHDEHKSFIGIAVWDTGATCTVIDKRVVQKCGLKPITKKKVRGVFGEGLSNVYQVNVGLPNGVMIEGIEAIESNFDSFDVLIGMDIIRMGDFAVTNYRNRTTFTFRCPSQGEIDFVSTPQFKTQVGRKVGRNELCPCGSKKKYKKCCGKVVKRG